MNSEFAQLQCSAQVSFEAQSLDGRGVHRAIEDLTARFTVPFGSIHRYLGIAHQIFRMGVRSCAKGDPDTGGRYHLLSFHIKRNAQSLLKALGYSNGIAAISNALQQDGEFITANSRQTRFARNRAWTLRQERA